MRRVRAMREIAPECAKLFVQSAGQLAGAYRLCAEAGDQRGADAVLHMIMDYPDQTAAEALTPRRGTYTSQPY